MNEIEHVACVTCPMNTASRQHDAVSFGPFAAEAGYVKKKKFVIKKKRGEFGPTVVNDFF